MSGYLKRIALVKTVCKGFSTDGGELGGLVKCEAYAGFLKVELSLINFAPLSEGRYRFGLTDGKTVLTFDSVIFETQVDFELSRGFAALVCFCKNGIVKPVASAVCGDNMSELSAVERAVASEEHAAQTTETNAYEDEAIAEVNYYEMETGKDGGAVCEDKAEKAHGSAGGEDAAALCSVENASEESELNYQHKKREGGLDYRPEKEGETAKSDRTETATGADFFKRVEGEVKKIFTTYPREERLEKVIEGSRWAKIGYGGGKFYAFGVIYSEGEAAYLCYGVPSSDCEKCPNSLLKRASFVPVEGGGFWIMYQDAKSGASLTID